MQYGGPHASYGQSLYYKFHFIDILVEPGTHLQVGGGPETPPNDSPKLCRKLPYRPF